MIVSMRDRGLAGLTVTDDQLALAAADRGHGVDRLDAGLQRLLDRLALDDRGRLQLEGAARLRPRSRRGRRSGCPSGSTTRPRKPSPTGTDRISPVRRTSWPSSMLLRLAEQDDADLARRRGSSAMPEQAALELEQLVGHREGRPSTRAMPSPVSTTRPTSSRAVPGRRPRRSLAARPGSHPVGSSTRSFAFSCPLHHSATGMVAFPRCQSCCSVCCSCRVQRAPSAATVTDPRAAAPRRAGGPRCRRRPRRRSAR